MNPEVRTKGLDALKLGKYRDTIAALSAWLHEMPEDYEAATAVAMAWSKLNHHEHALELFAGILAAQPQSGSVHYHHGLALEAAGRVPEAIAAYRLAVRYRPKFTSALKRLTRLAPEALPVEAVRTDANSTTEVNLEALALHETTAAHGEPTPPMPADTSVFDILIVDDASEDVIFALDSGVLRAAAPPGHKK